MIHNERLFTVVVKFACQLIFGWYSRGEQRPPAELVVGGKVLPWRCSKKQRPPAVLVVGEKVLLWRCSKKQRPPAVLVVGEKFCRAMRKSQEGHGGQQRSIFSYSKQQVFC